MIRNRHRQVRFSSVLVRWWRDNSSVLVDPISKCCDDVGLILFEILRTLAYNNLHICFIIEFLKVGLFKFFVSVSEKVFNISRRSLDFLGMDIAPFSAKRANDIVIFNEKLAPLNDFREGALL